MSLVSEVNVQIDSQRLYEEYLMVKEIADEINSKKNSFSNDIQYVLRILCDDMYPDWIPHQDMQHTLKLIDDVKTIHNNITQVNYRVVKPSSNYTEHIDQGRFGPMTFHAPIKTNPSCYFCYPQVPWSEQQMFQLQVDKVYMCAVNKPHTFMNAGLEDRVHIHLHGDDTLRSGHATSDLVHH